VFNEADFEAFMRDDDQIRRSAHARWMLLSERSPSCATADATSSSEAKGIYITPTPQAVGSGGGESVASAAPATNGNGNSAAAAAADGLPDLVVAGAGVAREHARVWQDDTGDCWVQDLPSSSGTWLNGRPLRRGDKARLLPQVRERLLVCSV
jgi:hypothetical protein